MANQDHWRDLDPWECLHRLWWCDRPGEGNKPLWKRLEKVLLDAGHGPGPTVTLAPGSPDGGPHGWTTTLRGGERSVSTPAEVEMWRWWGTLKTFINQRDESSLRSAIITLMKDMERS